MDKTGQIEIKITGTKGKFELTPDNYDIRELITVLQNAEDLLFAGAKRERPPITYRVEDGSVKHIIKTSLQAIIGFNALLFQINSKNAIDFLEYQTAKAFESFQDTAIKNNYEFAISTSISGSNSIFINKNTHFLRSEYLWIDAEFYFYGKITNMGGKEKANFHIVTDDMGTILIQTPKEFFYHYEANPLYKNFGIRAIGKQNIETGEIDKSSLRFKEIIDYFPSYDKEYLQTLRNRAKRSWKDVDTDKWLKDLRGGYNA